MVTGWVKMKIFFWKYYFKHATFLYLPRLSSGHHQSFFVISYFLEESLKANKNQQKRPHTLQYSFSKKTSLILQTSTHLTLKIICSLNKTKNLSDFTNFSSKHISDWCQKKYLHSTISWRRRTAFLKHFESKCLYISIYLLI